MRIHHLNCATLCPRVTRLFGNGRLFPTSNLVCHCLLVETEQGLVLVDAGLGMQDILHPVDRLGRGFLAIARPRLSPVECALNQVERLGFKASDVRHIVLTHLDLDHAGGISDFPHARVHVYAAEHQAAVARQSFNERQRYRPAQWASAPHWELHSVEGERWMGMNAVQTLIPGLPDLLLIPLVGHTHGHCGVAVRGRSRDEQESRWVLHAGDAYFFHGEIRPRRPRCPKSLALFQRLVQVDGPARLQNQARLRELARHHGKEISIFCSHDPWELHHLKKREGLVRS